MANINVDAAQAASIANVEATAQQGAVDLESKDDLKRRLDWQRALLQQGKDDREKLQRKLLVSEMMLVETQTALAMAQHAAATAAGRVAEAEITSRLEQSKAQHDVAQATERLRAAPHIDIAVLALYKEVREQLNRRFRAAPLTNEEKESLGRSSSLTLIEKLTQWLRRAWDVFEQRVAAMNIEKKQLTQALAAANQQIELLQSELSACRSLDDQEKEAKHLHDPSPIASRGKGGQFKPLPSSASIRKENTAISNDPKDLQIDIGQVELQALRDELAQVKAQALEYRRNCQNAADHARREAATAKQEVKSQLRTIQQLRESLKKSRLQEVSGLMVQRANREAHEAKKNMKIAVSAKQQELDVVRRTHEVELKTVCTELGILRAKQLESTQLQIDLENAKERAKSATQQVARSDIKTLTKAKARALKKIEEEKLAREDAENQLKEKQKAIRLLEMANKEMTDKYNNIFASYVNDQHHREIANEENRRRAIEAVVGGSKSQLSAEMYREKYRSVQNDLRAVQRRMRQLILMAHYDDVAHKEEVAHLTSVLAETRENLFDTSNQFEKELAEAKGSTLRRLPSAARMLEEMQKQEDGLVTLIEDAETEDVFAEIRDAILAAEPDEEKALTAIGAVKEQMRVQRESLRKVEGNARAVVVGGTKIIARSKAEEDTCPVVGKTVLVDDRGAVINARVTAFGGPETEFGKLFDKSEGSVHARSFRPTTVTATEGEISLRVAALTDHTRQGLDAPAVVVQQPPINVKEEPSSSMSVHFNGVPDIPAPTPSGDDKRQSSLSPHPHPQQGLHSSSTQQQHQLRTLSDMSFDCSNVFSSDTPPMLSIEREREISLSHRHSPTPGKGRPQFEFAQIGTPHVAADFHTLLSGQPRPNSAAGMLETLAARKAKKEDRSAMSGGSVGREKAPNAARALQRGGGGGEKTDGPSHATTRSIAKGRPNSSAGRKP